MKIPVALLLGSCLLFGQGCIRVEVEHRLPPLPSSDGTTATWTRVDEGASRLEIAFGSSTVEGRVILYRLDPNQYRWTFKHSTSSLSVREWSEAIEEDVLVINGVYFHEDKLPSGLLIADGERIGKRQFDADKSGLIDLSAKPVIHDTKMKGLDTKGLTEAAQSFPFLLKQGFPAIVEDSGLKASRSFIGTDEDGLVYLGVAVGEPLSLFELMQYLDTQEIAWTHVLNLDGGPSTGIMTHFQDQRETLNSFTAVPNVIVVERK